MIGIFPQIKDARRILVSAVCLECRRDWLRLKIARFRPANSADSVMQAMMPNQIQTLGM